MAEVENVIVNNNIPATEDVKTKKSKDAKKSGKSKKENSSKKDTKSSKKKEQATTKEEEATTGVDLAALMAEVKVTEKLDQALTDIREPTDKARLQEHVKEFAWSLKSLVDGYKFEERGALFASDLEHNCFEIDIHLVRTGKGSLPQEDCQQLYDAGRNAMEHSSPVLVQWQGADGKIQEGFGPQQLKKENISSMTISGTRKVPGGWLLPCSIEISVSHSKRHDAVKMTDIADSMDKGDYASVILQLHEFFKQKKKLREQFATVYNEHLGRLRFLVTQFQMMDELANKFKDKRADYTHSTIGGLGLEWYEKDPSTKTANDVLQKRAGHILKANYDDYSTHIKPSSQREIFEQAYKRTIARAK